MKKQKTATSVSNFKFDVDQIEKDFIAIIKKHYKDSSLENTSIMSEDGFGNEKGFYLIMIKREDSKDRKIKVASFGSDVRVQEIVDAVSSLLSDMIKGPEISNIGRA